MEWKRRVLIGSWNSQLTISRAHFLENILRMAQWRAAQNLWKLGVPVDKEKWNADPAVVNAFYDPNKNDIVFPAGILQPLFYSKDFPKSLNYGGIGVVIGHEITHGFDDKGNGNGISQTFFQVPKKFKQYLLFPGRQFDSDGNLDEWWNNETIAAFRSHAQCIIDQYSQYEVSGLRLNGHMTQGENIADNGGLKQAFRVSLSILVLCDSAKATLNSPHILDNFKIQLLFN